MKVELSSCGNIDHWQNPEESMMGSEPNRMETVESFQEASKVCSEFIDKNELGGGNWTGGNIYDENETLIARVSYNGRVWDLNNQEIKL